MWQLRVQVFFGPSEPALDFVIEAVREGIRLSRSQQIPRCAARPLAHAPVMREAGDGSETAVAAAAANIHDDGSGSGSLRLARATAAIAESAAGAGDATRIER